MPLICAMTVLVDSRDWLVLSPGVGIPLIEEVICI